MAFGNNSTGGRLNFGPKPDGPAIAFGRGSLTQGLVFAQDYNPRSFQTAHKDLVGAGIGTYTGTAANRGPFGWERTFLSTTDNDVYTVPVSVQNLHQFTVELIFKGNVDNFGSLVCKSNTASVGTASFFAIFWDDTSHCVSMSCGFATTDGQWRDTGANFPANQFHHVVVSYDDTTLANVPSIYKNGVSLPITTSTAPVGARLADDANMQIGNFQTQAFGIQADMVYLRIWNRVLTSFEVRTLAANPWAVYQMPMFTSANLAGTQFTANLLASSSPIALLTRQTGKKAIATNSAIASLLRGIAKGCLATSNSIALLRRQTSKSFLATNAAVALLTATRVKLQSALAVNACIALLTRQTGKQAPASNAAIALLVRSIGKKIVATNSAVALCKKAIARSFLATNACVALLSTVKAKLISLQAVNACVAILKLQTGKKAPASNAALAMLTRQTGKKVSATSHSVALLTTARGATSKVILATNACVALLNKSTGKYLLAVNNPVASLLRRFATLLIGAANLSVNLRGDSSAAKTTLGGSRSVTTLSGGTGAANTDLDGLKPSKTDLSGDAL